MPEQETKPIWQSKTVIAALITMIIGILSAAGIGKLEGQEESITQFVMQLITAVTGLIAIFGRVTATKKLTK